MAVVKRVMKKTHGEAVVKVYGSAASETIDLDVDLLPAAGQVLDGATQTVNIIGVTWTGQNATEITVVRGGTTIMTLPATGSASIDFGGQVLPAEDTNNTNDIVVTVAGGVGEVWLKLRKVSGYKTTIEPEQFGSHDNPAVAGS